MQGKGMQGKGMQGKGMQGDGDNNRDEDDEMMGMGIGRE